MEHPDQPSDWIPFFFFGDARWPVEVVFRPYMQSDQTQLSRRPLISTGSCFRVRRRMLQTWNISIAREISIFYTHKSHSLSHFCWGNFLGRCSVEAVSSKGLLWEYVIQASVLSSGVGSGGKALEVPGKKEGKTENGPKLEGWRLHK